MASKGRRTGVIVSDDVAVRGNDHMEDAEALFDSAVSPPLEDNRSRTIPDAATKPPRKPKEQVRFSLADEVVDNADATLNAQHPVRRLVELTGTHRASLDTNELSSVSTAALSLPEASEESPQSSQQQIDAALADDPNHDSDDELIPPPPDDEDDFSAADNNQQDEDFPAADNTDPEEDDQVSGENQNDNEFPAANSQEADEYDDDNDNEGVGFDIPGGRRDDNDETSEEEDPETPEAVREQRRRKVERAQKLASAKKKKDDAVAKSKTKKTKSRASASDPTDASDDGSAATPIVKRPAGNKKRPNPYATTFESKGQPLPQTFTEVPMSNFKQTSPDDRTLRRSKRARTQPLEFWRNEKYEWGANDFEQDDEHAFEGVTNMPVPIKIVHADPTPYKKRKISSSVPKKKKGGKKGDNAVAMDDVEPFDAGKLRSPVNEGRMAQVWDERYHDTRRISTYRLVLPFSVCFD